MFETRQLPAARDHVAPDGSDVRVLLNLAGGGMAHFEIAPGEVSQAVVHRTVDEIWYFLGGQGEMWRRRGDREEVVPVGPGVCLSIPCRTHFQFRALGDRPLTAVAVTMPPWPAGTEEAEAVTGIWPATLR